MTRKDTEGKVIHIDICAKDYPDPFAKLYSHKKDEDVCSLWACRKGTIICPKKRKEKVG